MTLHTARPQNNPDIAHQQATALFQAGRLREAETGYRNLLKTWKNHPQAHHALGVLLSKTNRLPEAIKHLKTANKLMPKSATVLSDIGISYLRQNDPVTARKYLQKALKLAPSHIPSLNAMGVTFIREYKFEDGEPFFQKILKLAPNDVNALENMGACLAHGQKDLKAALVYFDKAYGINPRNLRILNHLGNTLKDLGRYKNAERAYQEALAIDPNNILAMTNLATIMYGLRKIDEAYDLYLKGFELEPTNEFLLYNFVTFLDMTYKTELLNDFVQKAQKVIPESKILQLMKARQAGKNKDYQKAIDILNGIDFITPSMSARKHTMLGRFYDKLESYEDAFKAFEQSNRDVNNDVSTAQIDKSSFPKKVDIIRELCTKDWFENWYDADVSPDKTPYFLAGFPRSGTTLTGQILHSHPDIYVADEITALDKARMSMSKFGKTYPDDVPKLTPDEIKELQDIYWSEQKNSPGYEDKAIFIDKFPLISVHANFIYRLFPDAKILFINRHPYDCVLSCFMQNFQVNTAMVQFLDQVTAANLYAKTYDNWAAQREVFPLQVHTLQYETLTNDFDQQVKDILSFLNLDWHDDVRNFHTKAEDTVRTITPSYAQINQPIYTHSAYRWEKYKDFIEPMTSILKPYAEKLGYNT